MTGQCALESGRAPSARVYNRFDGEHTGWMAPQSTSRGVSQRGIDEWTAQLSRERRTAGACGETRRKSPSNSLVHADKYFVSL